MGTAIGYHAGSLVGEKWFGEEILDKPGLFLYYNR
jgi:hypothetical protein